MQDVKIEEIEEFIKTIEEGIQEIKGAINHLASLNGRASNHRYQLPIEVLKREKEVFEKELELFRSKKLSDITNSNTSEFQRIVEYSKNLTVFE